MNTNNFTAIFIITVIAMLSIGVITGIIVILKSIRFNKEHRNEILEYEKSVLNENETLPPLSKQFENDIVDDEKKVYKIKCPYCGSKYTSDKNKCPSCGAKNDE